MQQDQRAYMPRSNDLSLNFHQHAGASDLTSFGLVERFEHTHSSRNFLIQARAGPRSGLIMAKDKVPRFSILRCRSSSYLLRRRAMSMGLTVGRYLRGLLPKITTLEVSKGDEGATT